MQPSITHHNNNETCINEKKVWLRFALVFGDQKIKTNEKCVPNYVKIETYEKVKNIIMLVPFSGIIIIRISRTKIIGSSFASCYLLFIIDAYF